MCAVTIGSKVGRISITLNLESFKGNVIKQQVSSWLKSVASADIEQPDEAIIVHVGDATCESGKYDYPIKQNDESIIHVIEHYVACDQQVNTQHISLNVTVPEDIQSKLPSVEQTKALLEKSITRMELNAFAPPD